jgi:hypothetical protein
LVIGDQIVREIRYDPHTFSGLTAVVVAKEDVFGGAT